MDRGQLLAQIPDARVLGGWNKAQRQQAVQDSIEMVLNGMEAAGLVPDAWESSSLGDTIGLYAIGWHYAALAAVAHALTPPDGRSDAVVFEDQPVSIAVLRRALFAVVDTPI
jgi:hypothetical protein